MPEEIYTGFTLIHAHEKPPEDYLASDIPEIVIMAVLGKYSDELKNKVVRLVIKRLQQLVNHKRKLDKYLKQLFIFGRIRKLKSVLTENIVNMTSLNYDITKDGLYIRGLEKGLEQVVEIKGKLKKVVEIKGKLEEVQTQAVRKMLLDERYTQKEISEIQGVSLYFVRKIKKSIETEL